MCLLKLSQNWVRNLKTFLLYFLLILFYRNQEPSLSCEQTLVWRAEGQALCWPDSSLVTALFCLTFPGSLVFGACSVWRLFLSTEGWCCWLYTSGSLPLSWRLTLFCDLCTLDRTPDGIEYCGLKEKRDQSYFGFCSWL